MCMQSFVALRCDLGIFRELIPRTRSRSQSSVLGPAFRVQKIRTVMYFGAQLEAIYTTVFNECQQKQNKIKQRCTVTKM